MQKIHIDEEFKNLIPPLTQEEETQLEESLLKDGCRDALVLWGNILIDGHNRYRICTKHGISFNTIEQNFESRAGAIAWIIKNQLARRNLPLYERSRLALRMKEALSEDAKLKEHERKTTFQKSEKSSLPQKNTTKDIAKAAGASHDTIAKVSKIEKFANEDTKEKLRTGEMSINEAYQKIRRAEKEEKREAQRQTNAEKIEELATPLEAKGLFQTIVIDPPWDWGDEGDVNQMGRAKPDYHTMPIEEIEKLPVGDIADSNCHLYLWVTNRSLPKAFRLIESWGFRYITCITWVKPSIGMGNYFRGSSEQILFAVKGSQPLKRKDIGTWFEAPRGKQHSEKPEEFYRIVESCSYAPYIDIFGRKERDGWSVWGENG